MKKWKVVSLTAPEEYFEALSNFLMEEGAQGIEEVGKNGEFKYLKAYFHPKKEIKKLLESLKNYLTSLKEIFPKFPTIKIETSFLNEKDWNEGWKKYFKPIRIGSQIIISPPWLRPKVKKGEILIFITPGMGFGTGTHSTTRLCIEALIKGLKKRICSVLDVGTGSGILSIVAARLGAGEVWGIDTDEEALELARKNLEQNKLSKIVRLSKGSIGRVKKRFDLIVANLDLKTLMRIRKPLLNHLNQRGILILSGILRVDEEKIRQHYLKENSLQYLESQRDKEWVSITFKKY
ncbi:MAG: 50S ribosomal protein L11 methyltransferase [Thermodesulfobacteriota bacterium]